MSLHSYSPREISVIVSRLTNRDRSIICLIGDHGVLTTDQIARAYFTSLTRAQHRLLDLYRLDVLARFRRHLRYGSEQWHYALSHLGARIHAAATGVRPPRPGIVADRLIAEAVNPQLGHRLAVIDFFIRITATTRTLEGAQLEAWHNEAAASGMAGSRIRPDAAATYAQDGRTIDFWFEHDRGTETLGTLEAKLDRYDSILTINTPHPVLFELPSAARETNLHQHLDEYRYPFTVATTHTGISADPTAAIWRKLHGQSEQRHRLVDLVAPDR